MGIKWSKFDGQSGSGAQGVKRAKGPDKMERFFITAICAMIGVALMVHVLGTSYLTNTVWLIGIFINLFLGAALLATLPWAVREKYKHWLPENESFFEQWKENRKKQQKVLLLVFGILFIFAYWLFSIQSNGRAGMPFYNFYSMNLAGRYLLLATVILQFALSEMVVGRIMYEKLQLYMDRMHQINEERMKQALEHALEIERSSLEKVSRSDQLRMDLITNVSHDLKTPLTSMVGYLELLKKEELGDTAADYVEIISRRAGKLKEMIESLFSLAKVSSGNVELKEESISMNRLMEQIFADMDDKIKQSGLEFVTLFTKKDTSIITDNGYMYRICQNLLENALKYSAQGTRVFVKTDITGQGKLCVEITNTAGYRMNFDKKDIVERFARADAARSSEGNGLGLAIVSTYAKALGGEFDIFIDCDQFKARLLFEQKVHR